MRPDSSETAFEGVLFRVAVERWGGARREIVVHPGSVAVVAVDAEDCAVLVRQLREPAREELLELPAGTLEPGESPLACARRELAEETGLHGGQWRELTGFWTSPGFLREHLTLFLAERLLEGPAAPQSDERVDLLRVPLAEVAQCLDRIRDAKTLVGLLLLLRDRAL